VSSFLTAHQHILGYTPHTYNRFTARFSETIRVSWCQKRTSGLYGARED